MNIVKILIFNLISCSSVFGQISILQGTITDGETSLPLPFSTIEIFSLHTGTIANDKGEFELAIDSLSSNNDSIIISHLGYTKKSVSIADFKESTSIISLKAKEIKLDEVVVMPKKYKTVKIGITQKKPDSKQITNVYNNKIGNFIENKRGEKGWIKSVSYYIHNDGNPATPFRVRIYNLDKDKKCPGIDLLTEDLIVSANGPGWYTVDLTEYHIPFPTEGAFVVMEWINSGMQYFYELEMTTANKNGEMIIIRRNFYGQAIGSVLKQPEMNTWGITLGNDWTPYKIFYKGYINAMINAEIAYPTE